MKTAFHGGTCPQGICSWTALFVIAPTWNLPRCPSKGEWFDIPQHLRTRSATWPQRGRRRLGWISRELRGVEKPVSEEHILHDPMYVTIVGNIITELQIGGCRRLWTGGEGRDVAKKGWHKGAHGHGTVECLDCHGGYSGLTCDKNWVELHTNPHTSECTYNRYHGSKLDGANVNFLVLLLCWGYGRWGGELGETCTGLLCVFFLTHLWI